MNAEFEKYIESLDPEIQEKARACKTTEELNEFIADNDLELPEDALEMVSGGCGTSTPPPKVAYCKYCGNKLERVRSNKGTLYYCDSDHCDEWFYENDVVWR